MKILYGFLLFILFFFSSLNGEDSPLIQKGNAIPDHYQSVNVIDGEFIDAKVDLTLNGPYPFEIKRWSGTHLENQVTLAHSWFILPIDLFTPTKDPIKENKLSDHKMVYEYDSSGALKGILTQSLDGQTTYNGFKIVTNSDKKFEIESLNGQILRYEFQKDPKQRKLLSKVKAPGLPEVTYTYQPDPTGQHALIATRNEPLGRSLHIEYYTTNDFSKGKVKALLAPQAKGSKLTTLARFAYKPGETEVYDALDRKTVYKYSKEKRLIAIESQHPNGQAGSLYRTHRFYWRNERIISKTLEDGQKNVVQCETFEYDNKGNLIKQTLWGNLSGKGKTAFQVDSNGQPQGKEIEAYSSTYSYSKEASNQLLSVKESNGKEIRFAYSKLKLLESRFTVYGDEVIQREFFHYDSEGRLIRTLVDDGDANEGTEQRITEITAYAPFPNITLPAITEEKVIDFASKTETLLKKIVNTYTKEGWLATQEVLDSAGVVRQKYTNIYDSEGHLLSKTDLEGIQTTYAYDELGNPLRRTSSDDQLDSHFIYDLANRLIWQQELTTDNKLRSINYRYDKIGNKIAAIDSCGNTTDYAYDSLNRLITTTLPTVLDQQGSPIRYKIRNEYDLFDRVVRSIDPGGNITETNYTVRGKPFEVHYPDGTVEKTCYNLDGTVKESNDRKGNVTKYTYDALGHTIEAITTSPSNKVLKQSRAVYKGFRLLWTKTLHTPKIQYSYDKVGRVSVEEQGSKKIAYEYDIFGQPTVKKEWFGPNESDFRATITEKDEYNRVKRVFIEDSSGNKLVEKRPEDPKNKKSSFFEVERRSFNEQGKWVCQNIVIDLNGMVTETTLDAMGRISKMIKKNDFAEILSETDYLYDASGNTCKEIHTVLSPQALSRQFVVSKEWGLNRQLLHIIEGEGSPNQKITRYDYQQGLLTAIHKPDGTVIQHKYNDQGQLTVLSASDHSFHYTYAYDPAGNVIAAQNLLTGQKTERVFNSDKNLTEEVLETGLFSSWVYDRLGRLIHSTLPDETTVSYRYDAAFLLTVERQKNEKTYSHRYNYDHAHGRVISMEMAQNLGAIEFDYDSEGRPHNLKSSYWSQALGYNSRDKLGRMIQSAITDPLGDKEYTYQYDPLSRLTEEKGHANQTYTYDSIDNCLTKQDQPYTLNELNQLLGNGTSTFSYDPNGNVVTEQQQGAIIKQFGYDAFNRLVTLTLGTSERYRYLYDPFNRRVAKIHEHWNTQDHAWQPSETEHFLFYGDQELGMADPKGKIQQLRILGIGVGAEIGAAVLLELNGRTFAPIHDLQGSVRCLVDVETEQIAEFYRYSAFGITSIYSPASSNPIAESALGNPWLYSSKRLDSESGFYFYGKRYYSPELGRWITPDPIGFADGPNLYAFVHQNPLNALDLYGLFSFSDLWDKIANFFSMCFSKIKEFFQMVGNVFKKYLNPTVVGDFIKFLYYEAVGAGFALIRFGQHHSGSGVHGNGEINDKVRVSFINGVNTNPDNFKDNLEQISSTHGGVNVHYVYSATRGMLLDFFRACKIRFGFTSQEAYILADTWRQLIAEMGGVDGGGAIVHYAHSLGAGDTERALAMMSQEERDMIQVTTFGSPMLIDGDKYGVRAVNYVNVRDGISLLDPVRYFKALFEGVPGIVFVGSMNGFPFIDHYFGCQVYYHVVETLGKYFMQLYGA